MLKVFTFDYGETSPVSGDDRVADGNRGDRPRTKQDR